MITQQSMLRWLYDEPPRDDLEIARYALWEQVKAAKNELLDREPMLKVSPDRWPTRRALESRMRLFGQLEVWAFTLSDQHCEHLAECEIQPTYYLPDDRWAVCGECWDGFGTDLRDDDRGQNDLCNGCYKRQPSGTRMTFVILHALYNVGSFRCCPECWETVTEHAPRDDFPTTPEWW